jgi:hypothetical protein
MTKPELIKVKARPSQVWPGLETCPTQACALVKLDRCTNSR